MGEHSKEDDTVTLCRIVESNKTDDLELELEYFPQPTDKILMEMATKRA